MEKSFSIHSGRELGLSNQGQLELLRGAIAHGACLRIRVRGSSMMPFVRDEDILTIAPLNGSALATGDVVAFILPGSSKLAIHRIVECTDRGLRLRGDNSRQDDGMIAREAVLGRVIQTERAGRSVRLGMGAERSFIARLSRSGLFGMAGALFSLPRKIAAGCARSVQGSSLYRSMGVRLRPFVAVAEADVTDLATVQRHFRFGGLHARQDPAVTNIVAKNGQKVLGFIQHVRRPQSHFPWDGHWLFSMAVRGPYRGMGVGTLLVERVVAQAAAEGAEELLLAVYGDNSRAIALYRKMGFERTVLPALEPELEAEERDSGRRRIVMSKSLKQAG